MAMTMPTPPREEFRAGQWLKPEVPAVKSPLNSSPRFPPGNPSKPHFWDLPVSPGGSQIEQFNDLL
eukprot:3570107-Amphidinium_carterae.1